MSAREELFLQLYGSLKYEFIYQGDKGRDEANRLIDDLLHEEAEKIRKLSAEDYGHPKLSVAQDALERAVSLIDPYVKGG